MMYTKVLGWQKHTSVVFPFFFFLSFPSVKMKNLAAVQTVNQTISADHSSEEEKEEAQSISDHFSSFFLVVSYSTEYPFGQIQ